MCLFLTALTCLLIALPAVAQTSLNVTLGPADSVESINYSCDSGAALRVQYVNAGPNALALMEINGTMRIFVGVVSGSGARYVSGAEVWLTKGGTALLENQLAHTMVRCSQSDDAQRE